MTRIGPHLCLLLAVAVAVFYVSPGDGAVDFGYSSRCFFSVGQSASGAWWFIDPNGDRFLSLGVDVVNYGSDSSLNGERPYNDAVKAKFNNSQSAWADSVVSRLTSWNINTLGAWADSVAITKGMPYTRALSLGKGFSTWVNGMFPDVFDPAWEASVDSTARTECLPRRGDPTLIGYFLDNEMWWGSDWRYPGSILDNMLIGLNQTAPGHIRAVSFLQDKYSTIQKLNQAWNATYTSFDSISTIPANTTAAHTTDSSEFAYIAAVKFFNVSRTAIRKYDPYHMLLGARFVGVPTTSVIKACGEYNEVVSINSYPSDPEPYGPPTSRVNLFYNITNKPLLIGEFAYRGNDSGLPNTKGAGRLVPTQADRAAGYKNYTTRLAQFDHVIGLHWFQWVDQPADGRYSDGENSNYGLVNTSDATYTVLTNQIKTTNPGLYTLHESSTSRLPSAKCYRTLSCSNDCSGHGCCDTSTGQCTCDSGFSGGDCATDASQLQVSSFGSALDTTVWAPYSSSTGSQAYSAAQVSTSDNQLELAIAPCTTCGRNFSAGGVTTKSNLFGFGVYTAVFQAPSVTGFTAQFELNSRTTSLDAITLRIRANQSSTNGGTLDYYSNGKYDYLKWVGALALGNPSTGFHTYSIHYMPTYFAFYADGVLLGSFNSTTATNGLPDATMAVAVYISASADSPQASTAMLVKSVSFEQANSTKATCPSSDSDSSGAASLERGVFRWLSQSSIH